MNDLYQGGCHCGAVRYRFTQPPEFVFYCHCHDCQRTTGSPFSMELMVPDEGFEIEGKLSSYAVTGGSGKPVMRYHCAHCASGLYIDCEADPGYVFIKVGTLDDASWVEPQMHIYTSARQPWLKLNDGLPEYEHAPEV